MRFMGRNSDEFSVDSAYVGNPWEAKPHERPQPDQPRPKPFWRKGRFWIVTAALLMAIVTWIVLTVSLPTVCKLNLRMACQNFKVTVTYYKSDHTGSRVSTELLVSGNVIAKNMGGGNYAYFEVEDGVLYKYIPYYTGWEKEACGSLFVGQEATTDTPITQIWADLFNAFHYELQLYEPVSWTLKDGVDVGDMYGVRIERIDGHFTMTWQQNGYQYQAVFSGFMFTFFPMPLDLIPKIFLE